MDLKWGTTARAEQNEKKKKNSVDSNKNNNDKARTTIQIVDVNEKEEDRAFNDRN